MKNLIKSIAALAAVLSFAACQKEIEGSKEEPKVTHKVTFVTSNPDETKTSATADGTTVNYAWKSSDEQENGTPEKFHVYENGTEATSIEAVLNGDVMMVSAEFDGPEVQDPVYTCHFNSGVRAVQVLDTDGEYDQLSDVLVAKENDAEAGDPTMFTFSFKREVAVAEATLKNLAAGVRVSNVRIESTDGTILAADYDITNRAFEATGSTSIVLNGLSLAIDPSEHTASFRFITVPVENAMLKVSVTTVDAESKIVGKYVKEFTKAITFNRGNLKKFNVALENDYLDPHINDEGWFRVEDARALNAGDVIRIGRPQHDVVAGAYAENKYFSKVEAQYSVSGDELKRLNIEKGAIDLTLGGSTDAWTIANGDTYYTPNTDIKTATSDPATWKIQIAASTADVPYVATITDGTNTIKYNASSPRFKTYTAGQMDVYIYKKYGNPTDKGLRAECDVEFQIDGAKVEEASVTMNSDNNVFPVVYTTSVGAKTFSSDNHDVATIDENGVVTLVSDGTAKIKVEIAETEDMKEGSAEYTLTVNPEPVGDLLNRAWTGIENGSSTYAAWEGKTGDFSGNTYAGNSAGDKNSIQLRSNNNNSGIVITAISNKGYLARSVEVSWNEGTTSGRTLNVYGKNTAYTSASDLYADATSGEKLGTIVCGTSTTLEITGDYTYLGFRSNSGAMYLDNIQITWETPKPAREGLGFYDGENEVTSVNATVGDSFTAPVLKDNNGVIEGATYTSSATDVADFVDGVLTLKKKGTTTIKASVPATAEYAAGEATYTLNVGNKLTSLALANDSAHATSFYEGDEFSFVGIKLVASYNDETTKNLAADDLEASNFSGFDSSTAVAEQKITVSYTDNGTASCQYNIEIKPLVTLYNITVPGTDGQGNSVVVKGGAAKAAENETVTLVVTPTTGYYLTSLKVNGGSELCTDDNKNGGEVEFTMPAGDATVTASFSNLYTVTLTQPTENGTVKVAGTTTTTQTFAYGATVNVLAEPADGYELNEWTVTGATLADPSAASTSFTMPKNTVSVTASFKVHVASVHDVLTNADLAATSTTYTNFTNVSKNTAVYAGNTAKNNGIQLRSSNSNSGIVTTTSGGKIKTVTVTWNTNTTSGRTIDVYGSNTAYTSASDLYNNTKQGTKLGSIVMGTSTSVTVSGDYAYVGVRSNSGALNIDEIDFEWGGGDTPPSPSDPTQLSVPTGLSWNATTKTLSWSNTNTGNGTYNTDYKYQYRLGSTGSNWVDASTATTAVLSSLATTTTVYVRAYAINTTSYSNSLETANCSCTVSGGSTTVTQTSFTSVSGSLNGDANISYAATKGDGTTNPAINSSKIRLYKPASGKTTGGILTLTANNGKKIQSVEIISNRNNSFNTAADGTSKTPTKTGSSPYTYSLTGLDATTVTFTNKYSDSNDISSIKVIYK